MYLRDDTKRILEKALGITIKELAAMSCDEENLFVEKKIGKKPIFSKTIDHRISTRGNHLLLQKRITTMEEIDTKIMGWKFND